METVLGMTDLQIKLFTALGQLSVAGIVGYIAWQQWRTAQKKLKADLFDRRFSAYQRLATIIHTIAQYRFSQLNPVAEDCEQKLIELERIGVELGWLFDKAAAALVSTTAVPKAEEIYNLLDEAESANEDGEAFRFIFPIFEAQTDLLNILGQITTLLDAHLELQH